MGIDAPQTGLLSNGEEESKGNEVTKLAFKLLEKLPNFVGNVEGNDIFNGTVDVVDRSLEIKLNKNLFIHAISNIIENSIEAFNEESDKTISISVHKIAKNIKMIIQDNAGGIKVDPIEKYLILKLPLKLLKWELDYPLLKILLNQNFLLRLKLQTKMVVQSSSLQSHNKKGKRLYKKILLFVIFTQQLFGAVFDAIPSDYVAAQNGIHVMSINLLDRNSIGPYNKGDKLTSDSISQNTYYLRYNYFGDIGNYKTSFGVALPLTKLETKGVTLENDLGKSSTG